MQKILADRCTSCGMSVDDIMLAHSFERVMPGRLSKLDSSYWRVFAGVDENHQRLRAF